MERVTQRTPRCHLNAMRARLGHALAIGGRDQLMRELVSGRFAATFAGDVDADERDKATQLVDALLRKAPEKPPHKVPTGAAAKRERVKVRWSAEVIAQFKKLAPRIKDNTKLALAMGLPDYCAGAMSAARSRFLPRVVATDKSPRFDSGAAALPLAA